MHTSRHPLSALSAAASRMRLVVATLAVALCATIALGVGAATASAAGPDALAPGQSVTYPTWGWGATKFCATNYYHGRAGMVDVRPLWSTPPGQHEEVYVAPYGRKCIDRWWFGVPIEVTNISHTALGTYPVLTVRTY